MFLLLGMGAGGRIGRIKPMGGRKGGEKWGEQLAV